MPTAYVSESDDDSDQLEGSGDESDQGGIPGAVASANCRVWSTRELYERMNKGQIDVAPPYQRDVVWNKNSQSALIDSILKNKWVPTLLFSERPATVNRDGTRRKAVWVCMDGKQRLTSIKLFLDGVIPWYRKPRQPLYFKQSDPPTLSRRLLSEELQEIFLSRGLTAAMYSQLTELQERDIFRLVQEGKPLTTGEKMHASAGAWGEYIDELTQKYMVRCEENPNGWCDRITRLKRGADFTTMTSIVFCIRDKRSSREPPRHMSTIKVQAELDRLSNFPVPSDLKSEVAQLLDSFMEISTLAPRRTEYTIELNTPEAMFAPIVKGKKTMVAPVEMIWIPYMISQHGNKLSKGRLLEMIELLKLDVRKKFPREVKNNGNVARFITDWIHDFDESRLKGKYAGYAVPRPAPQLAESTPDVSGMHEVAKRSANAQNSFKRPAPSLPSPDPTIASSPSTTSASLFKRPRNSITTLNPTTASSPQPDSTNQLASKPPTNMPVAAQSNQHINTQAMLVAQRAQAATGGNPLPSNLLTNSSQSWTSANRLPAQSSAPDLAAGARYHALNQQQPPRFVQNYASAARPASFQLPLKPAPPFAPQRIPAVQPGINPYSPRVSSVATPSSNANRDPNK